MLPPFAAGAEISGPGAVPPAKLCKRSGSSSRLMPRICFEIPELDFVHVNVRNRALVPSAKALTLGFL
jgi:hypothetical protein